MTTKTASRAPRRVATDPRISRRRRAVSRSRRKRILVRLAILAALGGLVWVAFFSPVLLVRDIEVVGSEQMTPDEVAAAAAIGSDQNLLLLSTEGVESRVESLPWVADASVERMLPGSIRIRIEERTPAMILSLGAARWTIDATGHVLTSGKAVGGLPVFANPQLEEVEPGVALSTPESTGALTAWRSLPEGLRDQVTTLFAPTVERVSFALADGTLIRFGAAEDLDAKNVVLTTILERLAAEGTAVEYIDVRVPTAPALGPPRG